MKIEEIREAALAGKTFTFNDVKIHEFDMSEGIFNIIYSLPSVEYKPYCAGLDVKEISVYEPPKYDPRRLFKKGDKVRVVDWNGRTLDRKGKIGEVTEDELGGRVTFSVGSHTFKICYPVCFLELVTPVEELEPYFIMELKGAYGVYNTRFQPEAEVCHFFTDMHPHAKQAAEAERDRLNAEYRKEQNND